MANSVLQKPHVTPVNGRNGFDLGRHRSFTSPMGMLLPVFNDFLNPSDKVKVNSSLFIRTLPIQTAAFVRMNAHVDWFFVPIMQLMSRWNEFYNSVNDVMSTAFDYSANSISSVFAGNFPTFDVNYLARNVSSFNAWFPDSSQASDGSKAYIQTDVFGVPYAHNFRRLLDMLGYGSIGSYDNKGDVQFKVNPINFLAYHKIYHSHYRPTDWFPNQPELYNIDRNYSINSNIGDSLWGLTDIISTIHYRPYRKDYFTNVLPQPTFGTQFASYINGYFTSSNLRSKINPELDALPARSGGSSLSVVPSSDTVSPARQGDINTALLTAASNQSMQSLISAQDIRATFALDKLMRVTAFGGGHYEDQVLAHFGYKMPRGISNEAYYLGSQKTPIVINEVVANSTTATAPGSSTTVTGQGTVIGDIAGRAIAPPVRSDDITFEAPCHGVLMAIFSIEPLPMYSSGMCEVFNRYSSPLDFYRPELDNIGMQPLFVSDMTAPDASNADGIIGWTYRWSELKTSFDVVNEGFWNTGLNPWVSYKQSIFNSGISVNGDHPYAFNFLICPQYPNNIFLQSFPYYTAQNVYNRSELNWGSAPLNASSVYSGDNFLIDADFKCFKTSIMSVHSLPKIR